MKRSMKSFVRGVASVAILVTALLQGEALAAPITAEQAKKGMAKWIRARPAAHIQAKLSAAAGVRTVSSTDGQHLFHIVNLEEGGFIVTPADDRIQPVIAFSDSGSVIEGDNPLWNMLNVDLPQRLDVVEKVAPTVKKPLTATGSGSTASVAVMTASTDPAIAAAEADWAELLSDDETGEATPKDGVKQPLRAGLTTLSDSDVRVPILLTTKWGQATDRSGKNCYNYYTPSNYVCGCVATAGAQLMRYHRFPTSSVVAKSFICSVDDKSVSQTMMGGIYDWSQMVENPGSATTDEQRQAIGKLCYDDGVSCQMGWTSSGSGAATRDMA